MQTKAVKLSIAVIPRLSEKAFAQFDPRPALRPQSSLRCKGQGAYPSDSIGCHDQSHQFTIALSYELDVPGGAIGTISRIGTGNVTHEIINIQTGTRDGGKLGSVKGSWQENGYRSPISTSGIEAGIACYANQ